MKYTCVLLNLLFFIVKPVERQQNTLNMQFQDHYRLSDTQQISSIDSEDLTINNKNELILSLEKNPNITILLEDGKIGPSFSLPKPLSKKENYTDENKILEAVA